MNMAISPGHLGGTSGDLFQGRHRSIITIEHEQYQTGRFIGKLSGEKGIEN